MSISLDQIRLLPPAQQEAILNGPALQPPPGMTVNFDHPLNGNLPTLVIESFFLAISAIAVALAVYTKLFLSKRIYFENYLGFAGYAIYAAKTYTVIGVVVNIGLFVHQWDIRVRDIKTVRWYYHLGSEFYAVSILLLKVAIILEWMRIFIPRGTRNNFFWACHALLWTNVVFYITILIVGNASCKPYAKLWDETLPGPCRDNATLDLATAPVGFVSDLLILILPQRVIWRLYMSTKKKIGIALVFAIGLM
ncbi:hypothetical protein F5Y17DRAFT_215620 [Xylariaceae sp. FL0594]|nr:hypothetical protein F5Y17DRAFT_215620 [Xylariaceae sp. FL0594]